MEGVVVITDVMGDTVVVVNFKDDKLVIVDVTDELVVSDIIDGPRAVVVVVDVIFVGDTVSTINISRSLYL